MICRRIENTTKAIGMIKIWANTGIVVVLNTAFGINCIICGIVLAVFVLGRKCGEEMGCRGVSSSLLF